MAAELHLVTRCEHGWTGFHHFIVEGPTEDTTQGQIRQQAFVPCNGGSVEVLDPERVVWASRLRLTELTTQDILDALAQEPT